MLINLKSNSGLCRIRGTGAILPAFCYILFSNNGSWVLSPWSKLILRHSGWTEEFVERSEFSISSKSSSSSPKELSERSLILYISKELVCSFLTEDDSCSLNSSSLSSSKLDSLKLSSLSSNSSYWGKKVNWEVSLNELYVTNLELHFGAFDPDSSFTGDRVLINSESSLDRNECDCWASVSAYVTFD